MTTRLKDSCVLITLCREWMGVEYEPDVSVYVEDRPADRDVGFEGSLDASDVGTILETIKDGTGKVIFEARDEITLTADEREKAEGEWIDNAIALSEEREEEED